MLQSVKEERSRHFKMALRIALPLLIFVFLLAYAVFFHEDNVALTVGNVALFGAMIFVIVYFIYFALELNRKETLLDRVTEGYHYDSFLQRIRQRKPTTLAAVQINNLSTINENFGVGKADEILRQTVRFLNEEILHPLDKNGSIGRKTGAEFLIAVDAQPEAVETALETFIRKHPDIDGLETEFVFAVIRNDADDPDEALVQLRNLVVRKACRPRERQSERIPDARQLTEEEKRVIESLERGKILLGFRPLLNLHTGRREIYEVGVRLVSPHGTHITPKVFLPIVNRHNLGQHYDLLIFRKLLELAPLVDDEIAFSFNLSPFSLRNEAFLETFLNTLRSTDLSPRRFIVELYERRRHHRLEAYLEDLKRIRQHGLRLCLDNFGSSNASMEYLRHFPFDMIQFDRDYTRELTSEKSLSVLKSFAAMAREMGMLTAAKWVDDSQKVETLKAIGIDYIQGYAAGRILREEELLRTHNPITEKG